MPAAPAGLTPLGVTEFVSRVNAYLRQGGSCLVEGEVSGLSDPRGRASRAVFFTLGDGSSSVSCLIWANAYSRMGLSLRDGDKVVVTGECTLYNRSGSFRIIVDSIRLTGMGEILERLRALRERLLREGVLCRPGRRRLGRLPRLVGVVTSPEGRVIHDIERVINSRNSGVGILLYPAQVQGERAAESIVAALAAANADGICDALIVGRGGGSFEDLLPFSDERVARAVAASRILTISAVGHEPDHSLCDEAADLCAATPSQAAELVSTPTLAQLREGLADLGRRLDHATDLLLDHVDRTLDEHVRRMEVAGPGRRAADLAARLLAHEAALGQGMLTL
ncbi:MAG: exodeoxyribonuclease VII large subunit, partial [Succinivibrionaceae bacterium]|nr:exodeoxyribonuclease VII large subunit [Succinivibrionaceae bacterium]